MNQGAMPVYPEWQPIYSAPKDGIWFVAWSAAGLHPVLVRWDGSGFSDDQGYRWRFVFYWSPIPVGAPIESDQPTRQEDA